MLPEPYREAGATGGSSTNEAEGSRQCAAPDRKPKGNKMTNGIDGLISLFTNELAGAEGGGGGGGEGAFARGDAVTVCD